MAASLPKPLRAFTLTAVTLSALCWLTAVLASALRWPAPLRWPLFPPGSHFYDLVVYLDRFRLLHTTAFFTAPGFPFSYFAPGVLIYRLLYLFGKIGGFAVYLFLSAVAILIASVAFGRALVRRHIAPRSATAFVAVAVLTAFPVLFCLERGNLEILLSIGIALGLWAFRTGRLTLAAVLWGTFGSVKLYPLILLALFLHRGQVRYAALTLGTAALTTVAALLYVGPTLPIATAGISHGAALFLSAYTLTLRAQPWDHSLFALLKTLVPLSSLPHLLPMYLVGLSILMLALFAARIRHLPLTNQIVVLSVCMVLLPPTSYTYTLTQLYGALAVLTLYAVDSAPRAFSAPVFTILMALFAAALCPFNLVCRHGHGFEGQEKSLLLLSILCLTLVYPLPTEPARAHR